MQYRKHSIVINTRSEKSFNIVYKEALDRMTASIASKVDLDIKEIAEQSFTDITEEIELALKEIQATRCTEDNNSTIEAEGPN